MMDITEPQTIRIAKTLLIVGAVVVGVLLSGQLWRASQYQTETPPEGITLYFPSKSARDRVGCPRLIPKSVTVVGDIPNTPLSRVQCIVELLKNGPSLSESGSDLYTAVPSFISVQDVTDTPNHLIINFDASAKQINQSACDLEVIGNQISQSLKQFAETPSTIQFTITNEPEARFERPLPFVP